MDRPPNRSYEFDSFRIDGAERRLARDGQTIPLPPKIFDTLFLLVTNSGHLLTKDELMKQVWPDTFVEENDLTQNISALRKALGGNGSDGQYIETIPRVGYRFAGEVREIVEEQGEVIVGRRTKARVVITETEEITEGS